MDENMLKDLARSFQKDNVVFLQKAFQEYTEESCRAIPGWDIHHLMKWKKLNIVKFLINRLKEGKSCWVEKDFLSKNADGDTPLKIALNVWKDDPDTMKLLLKEFERKGLSLLHSKDSKDQSVVHWVAASDKHKNLYRSVIKHSNLMTTLCVKDEEGNTPLHVAAENNNQSFIVYVETVLGNADKKIYFFDMKNGKNLTPIEILKINESSRQFGNDLDQRIVYWKNCLSGKRKGRDFDSSSSSSSESDYVRDSGLKANDRKGKKLK